VIEFCEPLAWQRPTSVSTEPVAPSSASTGAHKILLHEVSVIFPGRDGGTEALRDVDLGIHEGEIVTLIGPSGSGKSTILNVISGTAVAMGAVVRGTVEVTWRSNARGRMGYVLQKDTLLPWRTLLGNVEMGLEIQGMDVSRRRALASECPILINSLAA
jgi:NitT/TauT family transport system ATP-binding protein